MKNIIKKLLREGILGEEMMNSSNLPKETALFSKSNGIYMVLYNPMTKDCYGVISASLRGENYDMDNVATEKGFGPYMYEFAMMKANSKGKGLVPSRNGDIRDGALKVWLKFYDRPDVKKTPILPFDNNGNWNSEYSIAIYTGDEDVFDDVEEFEEFWNNLEPNMQDIIKKYNTIYTMTPNDDYRNMLVRGEEYLKKGMNPQRAFKAGQDLFMEKYD